MGNCLVTKLKSRINKDLPMFGAAYLDLRNLSGSMSGTMIAVAGKSVEIINAEGVVVDTISSTEKSVTLNGGQTYNIKKAEDIHVFNFESFFAQLGDVNTVSCNYIGMNNAAILRIGGIVSSLPLESTAIKTVTLYHADIKVAKPDFINWLTNIDMTMFSYNNTNNYSISAIELAEICKGGTRHIGYINVGTTDAIRVEDFVAKMRGLGRTASDGNIVWSYIFPGSTFGGNTITSRLENRLSWTATTITFGGVEIQNSEVIN